VVVAPNSTWTATAPTDNVQVRAIDYAEAINADPSSPLYQRLDLEHIGAMGHSQGATATVATAADPRVDAIIPWNVGNSNDKPFLNVSGDRDIIPGVTAASMKTGADGATQPGAWVLFHQVLETGGNFTGHLVLMEQPDRVWEMAVKWWDWQLKGSDDGKAFFVGDSCGLCNRDAEFEYGHNALLQ
jgi:dienelactone hydrolase